MKRNISGYFKTLSLSGIVVALAVIGLVASSCGKEKGEEPQNTFKRTVRVQLTKGADTKTAVVEGEDRAQFVWTEGDDNNFYVYENGVEGTVEDVEFTEDMRKATLTVSFVTPAASEKYVYTAKFADEISNHGNPKLSAVQYPSLTSYDQFADILVSEPLEKDEAATSLRLVLNRKITVNKMTLKGLEAGEKVSKVEIELDKVVAGTLQEDGHFDGTDKKIVLNYSGLEVASDGTFPVYFNCAPVEEASILGVTVTTDQSFYNCPASSFSRKLTLPLGKMTRFNVDMSDYKESASTANIYTLVETVSELTEGVYIVVAKDYDRAMAGWNGKKYHDYAAVVKTDEGKTIELEEDSEVVPYTLKKNGNYWTFQNSKADDSYYGYYLAWSSDNTSIEQTSAYNWSISITTQGTVISASSDNSRTLQYNHASPRFACYSSGQKPVVLYKKSGGSDITPPGPQVEAPVINVKSTSVDVEYTGGSQYFEYTVTNPVDGASLTAAPNVSWIKNVSVSATAVTFYVDYQGDGASSRVGAITLSYPGAENVVVSINQGAAPGGDQAANGWLELPATTSGSDYFSGTFKAGDDRNYTYLYQYSTYTALWTAYPLYSETAGSSAPAYNTAASSTVEPASGVSDGRDTQPQTADRRHLGPYNRQYPTMYSEATSWNYNPQIDKSKQVYLKSSYGVSVAGTIYSRGHQIPNGDRKANGTMQSQTYYYTNSTPQIQNGFNGSIWNALENGIRGQLGSDTTYVVTGAAFRKVGGSESIKTINPKGDPDKDVPVPNYYWKVLLKVKRSGSTITSASAIGFWLEHKQYSNQDYASHAVSVDQIEAWTGFNFFVNLPENLQTTAEKNTNWTTFKNF